MIINPADGHIGTDPGLFAEPGVNTVQIDNIVIGRRHTDAGYAFIIRIALGAAVTISGYLRTVAYFRRSIFRHRVGGHGSAAADTFAAQRNHAAVKIDDAFGKTLDQNAALRI